MIKKRLLKSLILFTLVFLIPVSKTNAQIQLPYDIDASVPESCDDNGLISGTYCPCPPTAGLASVCGLVSDANIVSDSINGKDVWSARQPVGGVTVTIYENDPSVSSGQPFGALDKKFTECVTTEDEGKYHCLMRRINPGNSVYVVFSCNGQVADIKMISSVKSFVGLNSDVDCSGQYSYTPLPDTLDYANRDSFLGCMSTSAEEPNANAGFDQPEYVYESTPVGEMGGDIRFSPFPGYIGGLIGRHEGSYWEKDCIFKFSNPLDLSRDFDVNFLGISLGNYPNLASKCNLDPDRDGNGMMEDTDEHTTPFRYDIPTLHSEPEQQRVWETRTTMQRELQDPKAFAQYNHLMFGECVGNVFLRNYGSDTEDTPISCAELAECNQTVGDPIRNIHTALSFGSRLESPVTWEEILGTQERDPEDIVCHDSRLGDITVAEVQPPFPDDPCEPGTAGCRYKLSNAYYMPQFFIKVGGVKKPKTSETVGDTYGGAPRSQAWELVSTEADVPHKSGHFINYEDDTSQRTNSGMTAIRISSDQISPDTDSGVMANRFVDYIDAVNNDYDYQPEGVEWDVGGDVQSLCDISSINDDLTITTPAEESNTLVANNFVGDGSDHRTSEVASTATYATDWGVERDKDLEALDKIPRDIFDTAQRIASGDGSQQLRLPDVLTAVLRVIASRIAGSGSEKSFADRNDNWDAAGYEGHVETNYCIAEDNFTEAFPAYGSGSYPGDGGECYPWDPDSPSEGEYCGVWPGPRSDWPLANAELRAAVYDLGYDANSWPGIDGELRTCKINNCDYVEKERSCAYEQCVGGVDINGNPYEYCSCPDGNGDGHPDSHVSDPRYVRDCNEQERRTCLENQLDTWHEDFEDPRQLNSTTDYGDTQSHDVWCDLSRAGPMKIPGDITTQHEAQIVQTPFGDGLNPQNGTAQFNGSGASQLDIDPVSASANYSARAWISPVEERTDKVKASFVDYATTNDFEPISGDRTTHRGTAGARSKGFGTGATVNMLEVVSHPERFGELTEPFEYPVNQADICDYYDPNSWCYAINPPGPIDLDSITGGSCNPDTQRSSCPLNGYVPAVAERILGAAGEHSGVNGAVLLAAISGEGGWIGANARLSWTDDNVRSWSEPWYARITGCNDLVDGAQGPFGLITTYFDNAVAQGGYHPSRVVNMNGEDQVIVSKCNFIDAAYAAAKLLNSGSLSCGGYSRQDVIGALTTYRGGTPPAPGDVDIAMNCQ